MTIEEIEQKYRVIDTKLKTIASMVYMINDIKDLDFTIRFDICSRLWDECDKILREASYV